MSKIDSSVLSVVIPTHNRPLHLGRAILSALSSAPSSRVEVVVVPNGRSESWRAVKSNFAYDSHVKWYPIQTANVSAARNHGFSMARGEYVRFLDDDDYLQPEACRKQFESMLMSQASVSSGSIEVISEAGRRQEVWEQPDVSDFSCSVISPTHSIQIGAFIFKKSVCSGVFWDESHCLGEDIDWLIRLSVAKDINWHRSDDVVVSYVQHSNPRLIDNRDSEGEVLLYIAETLLEATRTLEAQNRLTDDRREAIVDNLWNCFQKGFRYNIAYWKGIASEAELIKSGRRPPSRIHKLPIFRSVSVLYLEYFLIPVRQLYDCSIRFFGGKRKK